MAKRSAVKGASKSKGTKKPAGKAGAKVNGAAKRHAQAKPVAAGAKAARPAAKRAVQAKGAARTKRVAKVAAEKVELANLCPAYYRASAEAQVVELPTVQYLTITGAGAPASDDFQQAIAALYAAAYTIKMTRKYGGGGDFKISPLECLWWVNAPSDVFFLEHPEAFNQTSPDTWNWKLLLFVPNAVNAADLEAARTRLAAKADPALLGRVRLEILHEPKAVQIMHVGPYASEPASIRKMNALVQGRGLTPVGHHHEIYLSDPRHTAPAKIRTILRHPVE